MLAASRGAISKNAGIEFIDVVDEPAAARDHLARLVRVGIVVSVGVPTIGGDRGNRIAALPQQIPEGFTIDRTPRKPATQADDSDRLLVAPFGRSSFACISCIAKNACFSSEDSSVISLS